MTNRRGSLGVVLASLIAVPAEAQDSYEHHMTMPAVFDFIADSTDILSTPPFPASEGRLESACLEDAPGSVATLTPSTLTLFEHWVYDQLGLRPGYDCAEADTPTGLSDSRGRPAVRIILDVTYPQADSTAASFRVVSPAASFGWRCHLPRDRRELYSCAPA